MSDEKILLAISNKDEQVMAAIIQKYSKLLWKVVSAVLVNEGAVQDVEECVADVFIDFWLYPDKYDPNRGKLSSWLSMVARSKAIDRYRQTVRKKEVSIEEEMVTCHSEILTGILIKEEKEKLLSCVEALEDLDKEILIRRFYHGQKPKEISVALNVPKKQVENHLYQTKMKLRKVGICIRQVFRSLRR